MNKRKYLIPSLLMAGFVAPRETLAAIPTEARIDPLDGNTPLFDVFKLDHVYTLAGHSSHSSHASHASHSSGSGGGYVAPFDPLPSPPLAPLPSPPPTPLVSPPLKTLPGSSNKFTDIVVQVQTALIAWGYYSGPITGVVDAATKTALVGLQRDWNLNQTGTITPQVLTSLKIVAN
jgi:His-Xaa-Ser repeat protein HxsA